MQKNTQKAAVLAHLQNHGSITSMEAIEKYGATRLSAIIYVLRHQGYDIVAETIRFRTRYGTNANVAKYTLKD